jgi:RND family efflux transporter MFP subunit
MWSAPVRASVLAMTLWLAFAVGCHRDAPQAQATAAAADAAPAAPEAEQQAAPADRDTHRYVGVVVSADSVDVTSRIDGVVASLEVELGDPVEEGDVVALFDADAMKADLEQARAALNAARASRSQARARLKGARSRYRRRKKLGDVVSEEERETARLAVQDAAGAVAKARAEVDSRKAEVEKLVSALEQTALTAPSPGRVGYAYVTRGAAVTHGAPIVRIVGGNDLRIRFAVPADDSGALEVGMPVRVRVGENGAPLAARVTELSPDLDPISQMFVAEAKLSDRATPGDAFRAGAAVSVAASPPGGRGD